MIKVYFTGSKCYQSRKLYEIGGKSFVKWYGNLIEVRRGTNCYYTVEAY